MLFYLLKTFAAPYMEAELPAVDVDSSGREGRRTKGYAVVKEILDVLVATALLVVLAPVMLLVAVAIKLSSEGPVIFRQKRLTEGGRVFTMYKFRTMRVDAESTSGAVFSVPGDTRILPLGRLLRKYRLDELPQLFNILLGDMSLVGPRPERPEIAEELVRELPRFHGRLQVKAGITGLAQTSVGYASCIRQYRRKLNLDLIYVREQSFLLDLYILWRTFAVIVDGEGAE
ncbi:MAG: sugar transferase [Bdellovibrionota bacterium]